MALTPHAADVSWFVSTSTFTKVHQVNSAASDSKCGPMTRHGPHQDAVKLTKSVCEEEAASSWSNSPLVATIRIDRPRKVAISLFDLAKGQGAIKKTLGLSKFWPWVSES